MSKVSLWPVKSSEDQTYKHEKIASLARLIWILLWFFYYAYLLYQSFITRGSNDTKNGWGLFFAIKIFCMLLVPLIAFIVYICARGGKPYRFVSPIERAVFLGDIRWLRKPDRKTFFYKALMAPFIWALILSIGGFIQRSDKVVHHPTDSVINRIATSFLTAFYEEPSYALWVIGIVAVMAIATKYRPEGRFFWPCVIIFGLLITGISGRLTVHLYQHIPYARAVWAIGCVFLLLWVRNVWILVLCHALKDIAVFTNGFIIYFFCSLAAFIIGFILYCMKNGNEIDDRVEAFIAKIKKRSS